jgi:hypothetical protein
MSRTKTLVKAALAGVCLTLAVATPAIAGTQQVGGGTWTYGTYTWFGKHCYSNYYQPDQVHHATAIMGSAYQKTFAGPGYRADADITGSGTCYAYWGLD